VDELAPESPLALAVRLGQLPSVELLLKKGASPDSKYKAEGVDYGNVLNLVTKRQDIGVVKLLLAYKADTEAKNEGCTPLHLAVQSNNGKVIRLLIAHHANTVALNGQGLTPLLAILNNHQRPTRKQREIVHLLINAGADVNAIGGVYDSALQAAAHHGDEFIVHASCSTNPKSTSTRREVASVARCKL